MAHVGYTEIANLLKARDDEGLITLLDDPAVQGNARLRAAIADALGRTRRPQVVGVLSRLLDDSANAVRFAATIGLGETRHADAVPHLIRQLRADHATERCWAAESLGKVGGDDAVAALIEFGLTDQMAHVRTFAMRALQDLQSRAAVPALIEHLRHPRGVVRRDACAALIAIRDETGLAAVREFVAGSLIDRFLIRLRGLELP